MQLDRNKEKIIFLTALTLCFNPIKIEFLNHTNKVFCVILIELGFLAFLVI